MERRVKKSNIINTIFLVSSYLFVLLFLYAATSKLLDFETFTVQLAQSPLLSAYAGIIAWLVPGIEILIACLLMFERFRMVALYASFTLMVMFTAYIYIILNFSDFIPCSCGGVLEKLSWTQHLIFNVVFIVLAGTAVFLSKHCNKKMKLFLLATLAIIGIGIVALLFAFSEKEIHRNNAFLRRYIPHPVEKIHSIDLAFSSYYFSGIGDGKIYLGNSTAPLLMTIIDSSFISTNKIMIQLDQMELPYRSVQIKVKPPNFYVADGTVPILFQGKTATWEAKTNMYGNFYFTQWYPIDSTKIAVKSNSSKTGENILGVIDIVENIKGNFSDKLLEKQIDGIFDTDGILLYNAELKKLIYTYSYRNQFIVTDEGLKLSFRGKTIDTVSKTKIQLLENVSRHQTKLGGSTILINKSVATDGKYLFISSPRLGKFEPEDMLDEASIIDVYDLADQSYRFSFYLYMHEKSKAREFRIYKGILYALQGNHLVAYNLKSKIFK
ncbi:MauE/DoxX family redox-associated membrane protein [Winogradskyella sp.]|uniref:MauE/DoxX family redox-associated membrane protein n=1 Tax=Winogradskyella sp. TaxID=1883156 RepID=UPI003AB76FA4